jgi:hypothetical protein
MSPRPGDRRGLFVWSRPSSNVTPAKAGVQRLSRTQAVERLDPRLRGDDTVGNCLLG